MRIAHGGRKYAESDMRGAHRGVKIA